MKIKTINLYKFSELSKEQQEKALNINRYFNVETDWWINTYEDAEQIGLKINGFDFDRGNKAIGLFAISANEVAQNIFNNHGEKCETYKIAELFMKQWEPVFNNYLETEEGESELMELEEQFLKDLLSEYANILQKECEYLQSDEAIIETFEANEYYFNEKGEITNE